MCFWCPKTARDTHLETTIITQSDLGKVVCLTLNGIDPLRVIDKRFAV